MDNPTILIVDDNADNIDVLNGILRPFYKIKAALNGELALRIAEKQKPDLILLDVMMPGMDGHEVCKRLKLNPLTSNIPVIFVTAKSEIQDEATGFEVGAVDYITKPVSVPIVKARVQTHLALYLQQRELEKKVRARTKQLEETQLQVIRRLGRAAEYKDNETGMHVIRMSLYTKFLAEKIGANQDWVDLLYCAAPMHDIGKIGIADKILLKPGKLDKPEWQEMQRHVQYGAEILGSDDSPLLELAREVCLYHHERFDGSGYPHELIGHNIPLSARIVAIADVFDALTSQRPYKKAWSIDAAFNFLTEKSGIEFDPDLVPEFIACKDQISEVVEQYKDQNEAKIFGNE